MTLIASFAQANVRAMEAAEERATAVYRRCATNCIISRCCCHQQRHAAAGLAGCSLRTASYSCDCSDVVSLLTVLAATLYVAG